jgi:prephenate dehydrogenase
VLTPHSWFAADAVDRAAAFWRSLGGRVKVMTPEEHDKAVALTSHLPHLVAAALAAMLPPELHELAASGFRDTTRVAGGDSELWSSIFCQNHLSIAEGLTRLQNLLSQFGNALNPEESTVPDRATIWELLTRAKRNYDALGS